MEDLLLHQKKGYETLFIFFDLYNCIFYTFYIEQARIQTSFQHFTEIGQISFFPGNERVNSRVCSGILRMRQSKSYIWQTFSIKHTN